MTKPYSKKLIKLAKKLAIGHLLFLMTIAFLLPNQSFATDALRIEQIKITVVKDTTATIVWNTNREAIGKIEYGLDSRDYQWTRNTNQKIKEQALTLSGLKPDTRYFFTITATDDFGEIKSFEQSFKTQTEVDTQ